MAVQMLGIKTKFTDDQGRPLIGGSVHTYYAGTSLPQDTFSDPELTVPNTNPVKLDDTGSANIFLKGTYRVRVFDRKGKFVEEQDNVDQLATVAEVFKNKGGLNAANERIDALTSEVNSVKEKTLVVDSIADLSTIKNPKDGLRVYVKSYYAGQVVGGGYFIYNSSKSNVNDYGLVINGWVRVISGTELLAVDFGLKGDGTNEYAGLNSLLGKASERSMAVNLCGLTITTAPITATGDIEVVGRGGLKLLAGSNTKLLTSAYNLTLDGDIELDFDINNNSGGTITTESHCTIDHSGSDLILKNGVSIKPSASINVITRATRKVLSENTTVDGGRIAFYAIAPTANVTIAGGEYKNSTMYDNIQVLNGGDVIIERVRSKNSSRSCIVVANSTGKARIFGNYTSGAKIDGANQGGWGIVASVNSQDSVIGMNVCLNNQRGPMTVDTYPDSGPSVDNRISVFGNILGGKYNDAYATTGLGLNNVKHGNVTGNIIFSADQGILAVDSDHTIVHGNTILDTRDFAFQGYLSPNISFKGNTVDGCTASSQAVIRFIDSTGFRCSGNTYRNLTGAASILYRISGNTKNWIVSDDDCLKLTAGSGYVFQILGAGVAGGKIRRNNYKADGVTGWQWYITSDNKATFSTHDNEIESVGTNYISSGANVTAGDDTVNGSRNVWVTAPTAFKSRTGQVAVINNALKFWSGSEWV